MAGVCRDKRFVMSDQIARFRIAGSQRDLPVHRRFFSLQER
jgi:hypothetical protein